MNSPLKPATGDRDTYVVPSVSLKEVAALSLDERERLRAELRAAEERINTGKCVLYDREDQRRLFERIYRGDT
jgi:hypothetical protein